MRFLLGKDQFRDGTATNTQDHTRAQKLTETKAKIIQRKNNNVKANRVIQEPWEWYDKCYLRERNKGDFYLP